MTAFLRWTARLAANSGDDTETHWKKQTITIAGLLIPVLLLFIGLLYLSFGENTAGFLYCLFAVYTWINVFWFVRTHHNYQRLLWTIAVPVLPIHLIVALDLGTFVNSGAIVLWGFAFPVVFALLFIPLRQTIPLFAAYLFNVIVHSLMQPYLRQTVNLPPTIVLLIFTTNLVAISFITLAVVAFFIRQRDIAFQLLKGEQVKAENLLLNILPEEIAAILKNENRTIAEQFDGASILFADLVGFTPMSAGMTPVELVALLDDVFSYFDTLVEKYKLEKIKTIGDCYMVASGVPRPRHDHAHALVLMALEMQNYVKQHPFRGQMLRFRVGINSGSVVAGVIGRKKFIYDLWGDAVNTASRMEAHGSGGTIQVTQDTYELIKDDFLCEDRGVINVKGKGEMNVWYVLGKA